VGSGKWEGLVRRGLCWDGLVGRVLRPFRAGGLFLGEPGALPRSITLRLFEAGLYRGACGEGLVGRAGRRAPHAERAVILPAVQSLRRAGSEGGV
jgi:hypothetical protein